jgi:hypothetical protein
VWELLGPLVRLSDLYLIKITDSLAMSRLPRKIAMCHDDLGDLFTDCGHGIERGKWLLKDESDLSTADWSQRGLA